MKLIGGLYIRCEAPACQQYVQLHHLASGCRQHLHLPPDPTVGQLLSQSHTPTTVEKRVATSLVKRMLAESPKKNILWSLRLEDRYSTHFCCFLVLTLNYRFCFSLKPLTLERITKECITTKKACRKTVHRQCKR